MGARGTYRISSMAARLGQERAVPGPRPPLLAFGVLSFLTLAALPVAAAGPELTQEWRRCRGDEVRSSEVAIQSCTAIIRSGREKGARLAAAYYSRATAHRVDGWYDRAIEDYDQAIRLDPKHAIAYNDRGTAFSHKAQPNRAIRDFDEAIRLITITLSSSSPSTPSPSTTGGMPIAPRASWTEPSRTSTRRSVRSRRTPWPSTTEGTPTAARASWTGPSRTTIRRSASIPGMPPP